MSYIGVYTTSNPELAQFEKWLGAKVDSIALHGGKASWNDWHGSIDRMVRIFDDGRTATFSIPMFSKEGNLAKAAAGAYDNYYVQASRVTPLRSS